VIRFLTFIHLVTRLLCLASMATVLLPTSVAYVLAALLLLLAGLLTGLFLSLTQWLILQIKYHKEIIDAVLGRGI